MSNRDPHSDSTELTGRFCGGDRTDVQAVILIAD